MILIKSNSYHMRIIPEYEPVTKLYLSFVQDFYNTRFHFGKVIGAIAKAALSYVEVEIFVDDKDVKYLEKELGNCGVSVNDVILNFNSPGRAIINEWAPIFCIDNASIPRAINFKWLSNHPDYKELKSVELFSETFSDKLGLKKIKLDFDFSTAAVSAENDIVFACKYYFPENTQRFDIFKNIISDQSIFLIPSLADEPTEDLDTYLLPIKPKVWVIANYNIESPQAKSVEYAYKILKDLGHTVHFIDNPDKISYQDIYTYPSYCNCIILNKAVIVPSFHRKEDDTIKGIFKDYGFDVYQVDCTDIVLANCGPHCISKTLPALCSPVNVNNS